MRFLIVLIVALFALPGVSSAAACGSSPALVGKAFSGRMKFDFRGLSDLSVTFNADCSITRLAYGKTETAGRWAQTGQTVSFDYGKGITFTGRLKDGVLAGDMVSAPDHGTFSIRPGGYASIDRICGRAMDGMPDATGHVYDGPGQYSKGPEFRMAVRFNLDCSVTVASDGRDIRTGTWSQMMGMVTFTASHIGATYTASLTGDGMLGSMDNGAGSVGTFKFKQRD